jgi:hypothetical protein
MKIQIIWGKAIKKQIQLKLFKINSIIIHPRNQNQVLNNSNKILLKKLLLNKKIKLSLKKILIQNYKNFEFQRQQPAQKVK